MIPIPNKFALYKGGDSYPRSTYFVYSTGDREYLPNGSLVVVPVTVIIAPYNYTRVEPFPSGMYATIPDSGFLGWYDTRLEAESAVKFFSEVIDA